MSHVVDFRFSALFVKRVPCCLVCSFTRSTCITVDLILYMLISHMEPPNQRPQNSSLTTYDRYHIDVLFHDIAFLMHGDFAVSYYSSEKLALLR